MDYSIGIEVLTIGEMDTKAGSYELSFALLLTSDEIDFTKCPPPSEWIFTNGYVTNMWGEITEPNFHKVNIQGVFYNQMDFRDYPFEVIELSIELGVLYPLTIENIQFSPNMEYSGDYIAAKYISGYNVGKVQVETGELETPFATFPHYSMTIPLSHDSVMVFMKKIFPVIILAGFGYSTFFMSPKILQDRITLLGAVFVAAIFFHTILLMGELPPIGYLTIADKIMITVYSVFTLTLISVLLQQRYANLVETGNKDFSIMYAATIDKKLIKSTPIIAIMLFMLLQFT
ncbi:MAG TPA: hypothetical protein VIS47_02470 [Nitrosopumilus sp.]